MIQGRVRFLIRKTNKSLVLGERIGRFSFLDESHGLIKLGRGNERAALTEVPLPKQEWLLGWRGKGEAPAKIRFDKIVTPGEIENFPEHVLGIKQVRISANGFLQVGFGGGWLTENQNAKAA